MSDATRDANHVSDASDVNKSCFVCETYDVSYTYDVRGVSLFFKVNDTCVVSDAGCE